ncbi:glycosyltransferase [Actibacterium sp. 188UL27-1]|uniref:glycosyltransferase n=1 Tax=Actibacterium sp. 188UL27-1 TaxID=2786961 RepID=UPI001959021D|nr:glycosyltransferase [Actibacterium sp. 188UL27-1]MBM7068177.1 glycosyltransferase [Actibacterium sp. 188UL27-1]
MAVQSEQVTGDTTVVSLPERTLRVVGTTQANRPKLLGEHLVETGQIEPGDLAKALAIQARSEARIGDILATMGAISDEELFETLSDQYAADLIDLTGITPDAALIDRYGAANCLRDAVIPVQQAGHLTVIATARPDQFADKLETLNALFGPVALALAPEDQIAAALAKVRRHVLARNAQTKTPAHYSCRSLIGMRSRMMMALSLALMFTAAIIWPQTAFLILCGWAIFTLAITVAIKVMATAMTLRSLGTDRPSPFLGARDKITSIARLPTVSIMVPLFREQAVAKTLLKRLARIAYPKELLDICLVVEADDTTTRDAIAKTRLPRWTRVVTVPEGEIQTKPRALNYALDFCRGDIIGVWDAEDAPAADQLHRVVQRFQESGPDLACLQGQLDFYNPRINWLSRCFTIEYASWFRVLLPGMEQLGLAIPLGGTTLFFRREVLEELGGWDAHNVTEDADLGIRLARQGYRTEMIETTTQEEANCKTLPWIKQRSRWLKGYAMTWAVHMRDPVALWRDLGPWQFFGVQVVFLGTLSQFLLAPLLWSFWITLFGLSHPVVDILPTAVFWTCITVFVVAELVNLAIGTLGLARSGRQQMLCWVPFMHFYFPLGAIASYKALWEVVVAPFYWDKTMHGLHDEAPNEQPDTVDIPEQAVAPLRDVSAPPSEPVVSPAASIEQAATG